MPATTTLLSCARCSPWHPACTTLFSRCASSRPSVASRLVSPFWRRLHHTLRLHHAMSMLCANFHSVIPVQITFYAQRPTTHAAASWPLVDCNVISKPCYEITEAQMQTNCYTPIRHTLHRRTMCWAKHARLICEKKCGALEQGNAIQSLRGLEGLTCLVELDLRCNLVASFLEVQRIQGARHMKHLQWIRRLILGSC